MEAASKVSAPPVPPEPDDELADSSAGADELVACTLASAFVFVLPFPFAWAQLIHRANFHPDGCTHV